MVPTWIPVRKNSHGCQVQYLFLDLDTCDRCAGTEKVLDKVMATLTPALQMAGYNVEYEKIEVDTAEKAEKYRFVSSPTIRVNGYDIGGEVAENNCSCCGAISGTQTDCRVFEYKGEQYDVPPEAMLAEAILKYALLPASDTASAAYRLPENLKNFYRGKTARKNCCSGSDCCLSQEGQQ
jgi:glutaredoxin